MRHRASRVVIATVTAAIACGAAVGAQVDGPMRVLFFGYSTRETDGKRVTTSSSGTAILRGNLLTEMNANAIGWLPPGAELSPDGTQIAYTTCSSQHRGVYTSRLDGRDERLVPTTPGDYCVDPRWSPDGRKLSYASRLDYMLHVLDLESGVDRPLFGTNLAGWSSWSPQSDEIVFENGRGGSRLLQIVNMDGQIRLLTLSADFGNCETWAPAWSPDGRRIAFTACASLYTVKPDGSDVHDVTRSAQVYAPRWSLDGRWLLFLSGTALMRVSAEGGQPQTLGILPYHGGPFSLGPLK